MQIVLISPNLEEVVSAEGDKLSSYSLEIEDALRNFNSEQWQQGWDPDQKILDKYGNWTVYIRYQPSGALAMLGSYADLLAQHCS